MTVPVAIALTVLGMLVPMLVAFGVMQRTATGNSKAIEELARKMDARRIEVDQRLREHDHTLTALQVFDASIGAPQIIQRDASNPMRLAQPPSGR